MEALRQPGSEFYGQPPELVDDALDFEHEHIDLGDGISFLEEEARLTPEQLNVAVWRYIAQQTEPGQWYEHQDDHKPVRRISMATGLKLEQVNPALRNGEEQGWLEVDRRPLKKTNYLFGVKVTDQGREAIQKWQVEHPSDVRNIEKFLLHHEVKLVLMLRDEIQEERQALGVGEPYIFPEFSGFKTARDLNQHAGWLREVQEDLLHAIERQPMGEVSRSRA